MTPLVGLLLLGGCASTARQVTKGGLEGSLATMSEPEAQEDLEAFATSEDSREAISALTASVTQGAIEGIKRELASPEVNAATSDWVHRVGADSQEIIERNIAPAVATMVRRTVDGSLATMSSEQNLERTEKVVGAVTAAAVRGMTAALADGMREDIGPALSDLRDEHRSVASELLADKNLQQAVGAMAHEISREVILGSEGALDTIDRNNDPYEDGALIGFLGGGIRGTLAAIAFGLLAGVAGVLLLVLILGRRRRIREARESRHREDMMMSLMQVMTSSDTMTPEQRATIDSIVRRRVNPDADPTSTEGPAAKTRRGSLELSGSRA